MTSRSLLSDGSAIGEWWHTETESGRVICDLCPRECHLKDGDRGFCFVRENRGGQMVLSTYGRSTGFCIDPIEKKPLNHFFPGTSVLSFGTAGCNLGCKFCQNWEISKSREVESLSQRATPEAIALAASELGCRSVAFTYNDPVIWAEYAIDTARACRERGVKAVAVTAGYIHPSARKAFYDTMDAANVDLKGFTEDFYWKTTNSHLAPVLETLVYLKHESQVWFEITNLMIPQANDHLDDVKRMADWIVEHLGPEVPVHFTAFHPDFRMRDRPPTPAATLISAYEVAKNAGIRYVYVGNIHDPQRQSTYCPSCERRIIERDGYVLGQYGVQDGCCQACGGRIAGCFDNAPGHWGSRRQPVDMAAWARRHEPPQSERNPPIKTPLPAAAAAAPPNLDLATLNDHQRRCLLQLAGRLVVQFTHRRKIDIDDYLNQVEVQRLLQQPVFGLFTTLKRGKQLRGCCGSIGNLQPLGDALFQACQRTALEDKRMPAISPGELPYLSVDISLLETLEPIAERGSDRSRAFEIGKHGLYIQRGEQGGLLLPSVSVEQGWDAEAFLRGVCRKAGLQEDEWQSDDCNLQRFAGRTISGVIDPQAYAGYPLRRPSLVSAEQLSKLQRSVANNLMALGRGATPSYFVPDVPDGTVHGLVLSLFEGASGQAVFHVIRLSMRPGIPMQSTLFEMTSAAFQAIQSHLSRNNLQIEIAVTVLHDPSAHGSVSIETHTSLISQSIDRIHQSIGLEGIAESGLAIIAIAGQDRLAVSLSSVETPAQQIVAAAKSLGITNAPITIYSMDAISSRSHLMATNCPEPRTERVARVPAVAGMFYPADDDARQAMVKSIFDGLAPRSGDQLPRSPMATDSALARSSLLAIMTPHAGLIYSGRIAAQVWREVDFPRRLLIVGPKHTRPGAAWAVAPCSTWRLSDRTSFENDIELASKLADQIDGMELDSAAHLREHAIEVQLPILEYLCPSAKLAGIAMSGGTWPSIRKAAGQLARLLANDPNPPLLVISSDMNHYAEDSENRRRDRLALDAIRAKDPEKLIEVCRQHQISMCGLVPAALVMQTLSELGFDYHVHEIAYATSGDVVKSDRVVGYAGLTFSLS